MKKVLFASAAILLAVISTQGTIRQCYRKKMITNKTKKKEKKLKKREKKSALLQK